MMSDLIVFSGSANRPLAQGICQWLKIPLGEALVGRFKNGETRIKIEQNVRNMDVFVIQPTSNPSDHHIMELLIMIDALRRASAARITAVIPYYGYAKQEKKTAGREPISAKLVANLITTAGADRVVALDLHAPAIQGFFDIPVDNLTAIPILADELMETEGQDHIVVVSPDAGGVARAYDFRNRVGAGFALIAKHRPEPDTNEVLEMVGDVEGKTAVIVDDMISTGGTLAEAAYMLIERGARQVMAYAVHPVFAGDAMERIHHSMLDRVVVTNTIEVPPEFRDGKVQVLDISALIAQAIRRIHEGSSVSALFEAMRYRQEQLI
ncbi:MAG TPA: ribose-phosphate pyrophosphokinase [Chloroflexota bacterium]|nr:ribose-phosphate pyrophosphokinase [Chloroflexota bacterium]